MAHGRHSYIAFYPSDWIAGTARMTRMQRSVYFDVCLEIWDRAEPCPYAALPLLLGDLPDWEQIVEQLVAAGKLTRTPAGLTNARAMDAATKARDLWEKKSAGGKAGADRTNGTRTGAGNFRTGSGGVSADGSANGIGGENTEEIAGTPAAEPEPEPEPEKNGWNGLPQPVDCYSLSLSPSLPDTVTALTDACLNATGIAVSPSKLSDQHSVVSAWLKEGVSPQSIIETLEAAMARLPAGQAVSSLRYFSRHVRQAMKRSAARQKERPADELAVRDAARMQARRQREPSFSELALASLIALRERRQAEIVSEVDGVHLSLPRH